MGQTLSHGVYLPNEGERNCYAGLASNWQILNTAVGAIAEKAPLVHTHTVSQITDFPAYGNAAGTICEGNDSRLSDARTPVAHTHTKSDVTDLLNSNFIPGANNSYDLGSSSYQWNNLYAKNYYYNGVAWGVDKQNEWTNFQRMTSNPAVWYLRNNTVTLGSAPSSNRYIGMFFEDVNGADLGYASFQANKNGYNSIMFSLRNSDGTNAYIGALRYRASTTGEYSFFPENSECDLGTSTNKWKTLNGINPGALSLPGAYLGINDQIKDPNGQLNAIDLNGGSNTWVSDVDCYLYFYIPNSRFTWIRIFWPPTLVRCGQTFVPVPNETSDYSGFVPVPANTTVVIQVKGTQAPVFRRSACLGNV